MRAASLGLSSAILFVLAFPPFELAPLSWVALVPLFIVVMDDDTTQKDLARAAGVFGFVTFAVTLRWFWSIFDAASIAFWAMLAWLLARTLWLAWRIGKRWGDLSAGVLAGGEPTQLRRVRSADHSGRDAALVIALPILWTGLEHFRSECWALKFGWITPGYAQASDVPIAQAADLFGVYGLTFVVVLASAVVAWGVTRKRVLPLAAIPLVYAVLFAYGSYRIAQIDRDHDPRVRVATLQYETNRFEDGETLLARVHPGTQLVVFPEVGAVYREGHLTYVDAREDDLRARARAIDAVLVVGGERRAPGPNPLFDFYNTLAIVEPDGEVAHYTKAEPVPLFADGVPSTDVHAYDTSLGRLGFAICYDFTHPHVVDALIGARAFVVASGDLSSWTALQHREHALVTHLRAIEHRRWIVRATSSGYSQIVDPAGRTVSELGFDEAGVMHGEIGLRDETTLYGRVVLWPARAMTLLWAIAIARELVIWMRTRRARSV